MGLGDQLFAAEERFLHFEWALKQPDRGEDIDRFGAHVVATIKHRKRMRPLPTRHRKDGSIGGTTLAYTFLCVRKPHWQKFGGQARKPGSLHEEGAR